MLTPVENDPAYSLDLLSGLESSHRALVTGITGPPGSGKSTLISALVSQLVKEGMRVAVLAVEPSSPFHGAPLLGERIPLPPHSSHPNVFLSSVSTRGALVALAAACTELVA